MSIDLSVNLNKIALIRNSREGNNPSVMSFAEMAIASGADGITVHPRPDQRHIRPADVYELAAFCRNLENIEFNVEGNPLETATGNYPGFIKLVEDTRPDQCTLVPDSQDQLTSDHGFDLKRSGSTLEPIIKKLKDQGMRVSLFMDPDCEQIDLAKQVGADRIEFYTGPYADAVLQQSDELDQLFDSYYQASQHAVDLGLGINAGHDLNLDNLARFATVPGLQEVSIGHAIIVDSLLMGFNHTVRSYRDILS